MTRSTGRRLCNMKTVTVNDLYETDVHEKRKSTTQRDATRRLCSVQRENNKLLRSDCGYEIPVNQVRIYEFGAMTRCDVAISRSQRGQAT